MPLSLAKEERGLTTISRSNQKQGVCCSDPVKVTRAKAWFTQGMVFVPGKNRDASLLSETLQREVHACKNETGSYKAQGTVSIQNEISARYKFA